MTADLLIDGTSIEARAATNAGQRLPRGRMRQHARAPVIEQDYVQFIRAFRICVALRAGDQ